MSPVTHRGRRRLDGDLPVERLRGLLDEDLRATGHDLPTDGDCSRNEDSAAPFDSEEERQWSTPIRARVPWVTLVIAGLVLVTVVLSLVLRGGDDEVIVAADPTGAGASPSMGPGGSGGSAEGTLPAVGASEPPSADGAEASSGPVTVHVVGEVERPGVVEVPGGSRIADAVEAAGGLSDVAVVDAVNMASPAADGAQIVIPDQALSDEWAAGAAGGPAPPGGPAAGSGAPTAAAEGPAANMPSTGSSAVPGTAGAGLIDLNRATAAELEELPKVGPVLAQRILDHRDQIGGFRSIEELDDVSGIGPAMMEAIGPLVTV